MKYWYVGLWAFSMSMVLSSCNPFAQKGEEEMVPLAVVNVLDKKYYEDAHIDTKYSVNIDMNDLLSYGDKHWDKQKTAIVVYCANYKCTASRESAKLLVDNGYKNVYAYEGGSAEWKQLGYPLAGSAKAGYLKDFEKGEEEVELKVPTITAQDLKALIEKHE